MSKKRRKTAEERRQYIFALRQLVSREVKRKYARSYLGIVWSVLNPLLSMAVLSMIFSTIFKRSIENYPIYLLTGQILWQLFSGATNSAMTALVDNKSMLIKVKLSKQTFVLSRVLTAFTNFLYTFIIAIFIMSAAVPCIGVFIATLAPNCLTMKLLEFISGMYLLLLNSVST